jgi:hypothetical protein
MLLQDMGLTDKIVLCDMEWGILREKIRKSNAGEERMIRKDGRKE